MNLDKLFTWIIGIVIVFAATRRLEVLQSWIWKAQAKVIYESRTSTWGSPQFFVTRGKNGTLRCRRSLSPHYSFHFYVFHLSLLDLSAKSKKDFAVPESPPEGITHENTRGTRNSGIGIIFKTPRFSSC